MQDYALKYIPSDIRRGKKLAATLCAKNYKYFGSLPLDISFNTRLKSCHIKSVKKVRFDLSSAVQRTPFFSRCSGLKKCERLTVKSYQKDYLGKLKVCHLLKRSNKLQSFIMEIDVGFDFVQSNKYFLAHNMIKYFRLRNISVHFLEYGNNLDLCLPGDGRRNILKELIKVIGRQTYLKALSLRFSDYTIESSYASELDHISNILPKLPYLEQLDLGQPFGSLMWNQESSKRLMFTLSQCRHIKRFELMFDHESSRVDLNTIRLLKQFTSLKQLDLIIYVTKGLKHFMETMEAAVTNLKFLNITIYMKENCNNFWQIFGKWLGRLQKLKHLAINYKSHISVDASVLKLFLDNISQLKLLEKLDVKGPFEKKPNTFLILLLNRASTLDSLKQLTLETYSYNSGYTDKDMKVILDTIETVSSKLHGLSLVFGTNKMTEESLIELDKALSRAVYLKNLELAIRPKNLSNTGLDIINKIIQKKNILEKLGLDIVGNDLNKETIKDLVRSMLSTVKTGKVDFTAHNLPTFQKEDVKEIKTLIKTNKGGENWITYFPSGIKHCSEFQYLRDRPVYGLWTLICQGLWSIFTERMLYGKRVFLH